MAMQRGRMPHKHQWKLDKEQPVKEKLVWVRDENDPVMGFRRVYQSAPHYNFECSVPGCEGFNSRFLYPKARMNARTLAVT